MATDAKPAEGSHVHVLKYSGSQLNGAVALRQISDSIREADAGGDK